MSTAARPIELRSMEARVFRFFDAPCGVVVFDPLSRQAAFRFRRDWADWAGEEAENIEAVVSDLETKFSELGPDAFFAWIDERLRHTLSLEDKSNVLGRDVDTTAQALYRRHVRTEPRKFSTHLPLYSIRAAAGGFGADTESDVEDWVEVHGARTLNKDEFVLRITGRSMEPDIPDGALCLFRKYHAGSRKGQIVLVQRVSSSDTGGELTIKRYSSQPLQTAEGWQHASIEMQPRNPEFAPWQLDESERNITIAVFERVLEEPLAD